MASSVALPPAIINSYCFRDFVSPHIAAAQKGVVIDLDAIVTACPTAQEATDLLIVEGVGGFRVPLGVDRDSADLAVALGLPVILVVGLRLGCINQALLAGEAIARRGLALAASVATLFHRFSGSLYPLALPPHPGPPVHSAPPPTEPPPR